MERKALKALFETLEHQSMEQLELINFIDLISNSEFISDYSEYLYLFTKILKEYSDKMDKTRSELQFACLDF